MSWMPFALSGYDKIYTGDNAICMSEEEESR